jgi:hypothetical protein
MVAITVPEEELCQSTKQELRDLILALQARAQAEEDITLDWETRSRVAQGLICARSVSIPHSC